MRNCIFKYLYLFSRYSVSEVDCERSLQVSPINMSPEQSEEPMNLHVINIRPHTTHEQTTEQEIYDFSKATLIQQHAQHQISRPADQPILKALITTNDPSQARLAYSEYTNPTSHPPVSTRLQFTETQSPSLSGPRHYIPMQSAHINLSASAPGHMTVSSSSISIPGHTQYASTPISPPTHILPSTTSHADSIPDTELPPMNQAHAGRTHNISHKSLITSVINIYMVDEGIYRDW